MITHKALTLSIVIPAYNEEHHLKTCLDSIAKQTKMPDEVLVVDNNSSDKTIEVASSYPFVTVLKARKQGVVYARDTGFNATKSDIIGRIDADTILEPNWVEEIISAFQHHHIAAVTGPVSFYDMPFAPANYRADHFFKALLYKHAKNFPFLFGTNMAIRHSAWLAIRDQVCNKRNIHEDIDIAIHLHEQKKKILYEPKILAGMSARRYDDSWKDFYEYINMYRSTYDYHHIETIGPQVAISAYTFGYVMLKPLRNSYNPATKRHSIKHFLRGGNKPRKNPMSE